MSSRRSGIHPWAWLYARLYVRSARRWPGLEDPSWYAVNGLSMVMWFTALGGLLVIVAAFHVRVAWGAMGLPFVLFGGVLLLGNYWRFVRLRKADPYVERMLGETAAEARRGSLQLAVCIIASLVVPAAIAVLTVLPR